MPRCFIHLRDGADEIIDPEGREYADVEALKQAVILCARDLMAGDTRNGLLDFRYRIDAVDAARDLIYRLPFKHAVNIIPELN